MYFPCTPLLGAISMWKKKYLCCICQYEKGFWLHIDRSLLCYKLWDTLLMEVYGGISLSKPYTQIQVLV